MMMMDIQKRLKDLLSVLHKREQTPEMQARIKSVEARLAGLDKVAETMAKANDSIPEPPRKKKKIMVEKEVDE